MNMDFKIPSLKCEFDDWGEAVFILNTQLLAFKNLLISWKRAWVFKHSITLFTYIHFAKWTFTLIGEHPLLF